MKKLIALLLALMMLASLAACTSNQQQPGTTEPTGTEPGTTEPTGTEPGTEPAGPAMAAETWEYDPANYYDDSEVVYNGILGEYYEYYEKALAANDVSERYALEAIAEAKLLNAAIMLPTTTKGGNYAISRVVPKTINSTLWGNDSDRFHNALVVTEFMLPADRNEIKAKWAELAGTGEFAAWVENFLAEKGYEVVDHYELGYTSDPQTWDGLATYRSADSEAIVNTIDGLLEYDIENVQKPALAESYTINDDHTVFTFKLREGAVWCDSQGRVIGEVTADDFVAGMQHLLDVQGGLEGLAADDGVKIVNAGAYINGEVVDFAEVGVKAIDKYTVEYTVEEPCMWFTTLLGYNPFFPLNRAYYESQGGKFGADFDAEAADYLFGKDPDHIAYCGPYLVTNATEANTIVFAANPNYWNKDNIKLKTITWLFNDGSDDLKAYHDAQNGVISGCGLNTAAVEAARADGLFDTYSYISDTDATSYMAFFNVMRNQFVNVNDATVGVSTKTVDQAKTYNAFMQNIHFRHALATSVDRGTYNAQSVGEELKLNNLRNSYVPGNFVSLPEEVTVDINGTPTTFAAGTYYGAIMQAQLDADGFQVKVWDPTADGGIGSGDGYDGWYNPEYSNAEFQIALQELAAEGYNVDKDNPIVIEIPYAGNSQVRTNRANVVKQSIEATFGGLVKVVLVDCIDTAGWLYAGYYPDYGYEMNADFMDVSGWGPDYGDPQTYLATMTPAPGGMVKSCGIY
ncbi:MAG: peptide ABC transporter substrate-binding protein [Oscillospiraceae bacterium]|nr:peptide ABC transporter substrate-binding protein [Oscillospiraceae bacterium]